MVSNALEVIPRIVQPSRIEQRGAEVTIAHEPRGGVDTALRERFY